MKWLFREIRKNPYENPIFFRDNLYLFFALHCHYTGDTQYRVWFDLDNSLTRWKNLFLKWLFREIRKIPYENPIFFRGKLYLFFALHCHYTGDTQYRVWFDLDNSLTRWKRFFFKFLKFRNSRISQNSVSKPNFFQGTLYQQLLALHCHYIGDTPYRVWFDLDNSLTRWKKPIYKIPFSRNSQNSVRKTIFFRGKLYLFFALHCHYTGDTQYRVWFDLDNSLTRWKRFFFKFLKFRNSRNSQNSVSKPNFFQGTLYQKLFCFTLSLHWWYSILRLVWFGQLLNPMKKTYFWNGFFAKFAKFRTKTQIFSETISTSFLFYTVITLVILNTEFGLIWTTPWPDEKNLFLKWLFREIRKIPYENPIFFRGKLYLFFALHCHYTGDTQYRVWFDLDNSLTRWKRFFLKFLKFRNSRISKNSVSKPNFFQGTLYQKLLALHCHYIGDTPYRVWFDLDNSLTRWKKPIYKIRFLRNSQNSVRKPIFFPRQALPLFCFTLSLHWWYSIPSLVWFGQLLDPMKKIFLKFLKFRNSRNSQNSVSKPNFFQGTLCQKLFCFTLSLHWWYSILRLVWFGQLLNPMKKTYFWNGFFAKFAKFRTKTQFFSETISTSFLLYTVITLVILNTEFGLIWTTPWPDEKNLFLKWLFREIRKIPYENQIFFRGKLYLFFALHCH